MKVTRNLPQQLIVEDRPWLISLILVIFILIFAGASIAAFAEGELLGGVLLGLGAGLGGVAMFLFSRRVQVVFDRPSDTITIKRRTMRGTTIVHHKLSNLGGAVLERSSGNSADTYRVALVLTGGMSEGRHPVTDYYISGRSAPRLHEAINAWLATAKVDSDAASA